MHYDLPLWKKAIEITTRERERARDPLAVLAMLDTCWRVAALDHLERAMGWKCAPTRRREGGERGGDGQRRDQTLSVLSSSILHYVANGKQDSAGIAHF